MSITLRLVLSLSALMALFWATTAVLTRNVFIDEIDEIITQNMAISARHLMPLVLQLGGSKPEAEDAEFESGEVTEFPQFGDDEGQPDSGVEGFLAFEVRNSAGQVVMRSEDAAAFGLQRAPKPGFVHWRDTLAFTLVDRDTGMSLTVLEPGEHRDEAIAEATHALLMPLLFLIPLIALAIWIIARISLAPVKGLSRQIAARGGHDLSPIEMEGQPRELRTISGALDRLLDRLRAALDAERVLAANSAHELRTPLAGALIQAQQLKAELGEGPAAERLGKVETALKHLVDFTEKLLQLSRAEAGLGIQGERQNLSPVLAAVEGEFTSRAINPLQIETDNRLGQDLMVAMDADAFAICLRNLLENAGLHGAAHRPVRVVIGKDWTVSVINEGTPVASAALSQLTERYFRGETTAHGSGLGLAIVDRIMRQSGGALILASPAIGLDGGFEARLVLP